MESRGETHSQSGIGSWLGLSFNLSIRGILVSGTSFSHRLAQVSYAVLDEISFLLLTVNPSCSRFQILPWDVSLVIILY